MKRKSRDASTVKTFNPLDKKNLGESVAEALLQQPIFPLPPDPFIGAGIYAIYYEGTFTLYDEIAKNNKDGMYSWPIYVGKAVPAGARKGGFGLDTDPGQVLYKRLEEHSNSINQATNLDLVDFRCRYLVVDDIWIPLAESLLIEMLSPLWNKKIDGFGNHDPGSGRHNQQRSAWDMIHPGRPCAEKLKLLKTDNDALREQTLAYITTAAKKIILNDSNS